MDELLSEKEQVERIRAWWSEYGWYVIGGIALGVALLYGWNYYQTSRVDAGIAASGLYDALVEHIADDDVEGAEGVADELALDYGDTVYAAQSKLALARLYMDRNRDQDAAEVLRQLLELRGHDNLRHVGRLRLARILLYQDKPDEVVALLGDRGDSAFAARYSEALGDAYVALERYEDARGAYQAALDETVATVDREFVQLKLLDLPEPGGVADAGTDAADPAQADDEGTRPVDEADDGAGDTE